MKVVPLGDRVLVKRIDAEDKTAGGIILPDAAKEKPKEGKVIAVGDGRLDNEGKRHDFTVKKGDRVLFASYGGTDVTVEGEEYLILGEDDILAIVE